MSTPDPKRGWPDKLVAYAPLFSLILAILQLTDYYKKIWWHTDKTSIILTFFLLTGFPIAVALYWALYKRVQPSTPVGSAPAPEAGKKRRIRIVVASCCCIPFLVYSTCKTWYTLEHADDGTAMVCPANIEQKAEHLYQKAADGIADSLEQIILFAQNSGNADTAILKYQQRLVDGVLNSLHGEGFNKICMEDLHHTADSVFGTEIMLKTKKMQAMSDSLNKIITYSSNDFDSYLNRRIYPDRYSCLPDMDDAIKIVHYQTGSSTNAVQDFEPQKLADALRDFHENGQRRIIVVKYISTLSGKISTLFVRFKDQPIHDYNIL